MSQTLPSPDPASVRDDDIHVDAAGPADRAAQTELFNACFKKRVVHEQLVWRYDRSPHGGSLSFLARPPSGEGVSGYACSPRIALSFGAESHAAPIGQTGDVMTHPAWRKRGIFSGLDRAAMAASRAAGWPIVFGLPNRRSAHIFLTLGWQAVGRIRPYTFLLAGGAPARRLRHGEGRLAGWMSGFAVRTCRGAERRLARAAGGSLAVAPLGRFPADVRDVARPLERNFSLMVRRDADYLNWRFIDTPSKRQRALAAYGPGRALVGYAVIQPPLEPGGVGHFVDLVAPEPAARAALVLASLEELRRAGALAVQATAVDGSAWAAELLAAGFLRPRPENHLIVILHVHQPDHPLARAASDASRWYLTDGDRDDETVG